MGGGSERDDGVIMYIDFYIYEHFVVKLLITEIVSIKSILLIIFTNFRMFIFKLFSSCINTL